MTSYRAKVNIYGGDLKNNKYEIVLSLITGIISSIISSIILQYLNLKISQIAIYLYSIFLSFIILGLLITYIVIRKRITKYKEDVTDFLNEVNKRILSLSYECSTRKEFHDWISKGILMYLNAIPGLLALKYKTTAKSTSKKSQFFAALYFYNNVKGNITFENYGLKEFGIEGESLISADHIKGLSDDTKKNATDTIFGWVLDQEKTKEHNIMRKAEKLGSKMAWNPKFIQTGIGNNKYISIKSGFSILLEYQGNNIGILGVGATEYYGIWLDECAYIQQISSNIIQWLIHMENLCPWHRRGWRQINTLIPIIDYKFTFSKNQYSDEEVDEKLNRPEFEHLKGYYKERINMIKNSKIDEVYITGSFNGWRKDHLKMRYNKEANEWEVIIHLPKGGSEDAEKKKDGYYEYCYIVKINNQDYWIFNASADIKRGDQNNINSVLIL